MGQRLPLHNAPVPCLPDELNPPIPCRCLFHAGIPLPERTENPALHAARILRGDVPQFAAVCLSPVFPAHLGDRKSVV